MKRARLSDEDIPLLDRVTAEVLPRWPGRHVRLDGSMVHVRDTPGDGEPALYVHGLGGSATNWTDLAALLSHRLDGQAIDLPGFGLSDPPRPGGYRQQAFADHVIRWIEHSRRGPVHLLGNSLGGAVVVRVAARRPDLVRTLTLVSPAMPQIRTSRWRAQMVPMMFLPNVEKIAARRLAGASAEQIARGVLQACFADLSRIPAARMDEAIADTAHRLELPWAADAYIRSFRGLVTAYLVAGERSLWSLARDIKAPTLVVWGREDQLVPVRLAPRTARVIPDSRLMILDGVGHTAQMESPERVARAVLGMLAEVSERVASE